MTSEDSRQIPTHRKLIYAATLVILALLVCEAGLRLRAWIRYGSASTAVRDPMVVYDKEAGLYVPKPGYEVKGANIHIKINSLGFRGDEFSIKKPAHTVRIVCLGASTTFNSEVSSNDATWPHRLQERLTRAYQGVKFEVINAAMPGYVASDNLQNLRGRVLALDPDLVIYYEANNEIVHDTRELAVREGLLNSDGGRQSPVVAAMARYSLMFDLAYKNLAIAARSRTASIRTIEHVPADLPGRFIGVLDEMRAELESRRIPFLLSTFVVKYRRDQDRATQIANADVAFYYMPWMSIEGMLNAVDAYNQAIVDYGTRRQLPLVDDRNSIPPDNENFADCMHFLDKGAEAMADRFLRYLRGSGLIDAIVSRRIASE